MKEVQIISTGKYVPNEIITNEQLSKFIDTNDEWIKSRTGIKERRISKSENTSELAAQAALKALNKSNIKPEDLELIIVATSTPDCLTPSTACIVQHKIKAINAVCFDISAACSGFIYALTTACQFIKNNIYKNALVIGAETLSKILDWDDRSSCILFGDGAGAAILKASEEKGILKTYIASNGEGAKLLKCNVVASDNELREKLIGKYPYGQKQFLTMDGKEIFKFAVNIIEYSIEKILKDLNLSIDEIKYIIPHQANLRIINHVIRKLKVPKNKFYVNLQHYGNTSAASIPIALAEMQEKSMLNKGDKIIMVAFGGGLTWGAALIEWK